MLKFRTVEETFLTLVQYTFTQSRSTMASPKQLDNIPLADGFIFGESLRFNNGLLYASDMIGKRVYSVDAFGRKECLFEVENGPNGMCFAPDGSLIYSSMFDAKLYRYELTGKHTLYADLSSVMTGYCGDMVIDRAGRVYVDDSGARVLHGEQLCPGRLLIVEKDGSVRSVQENLDFPNALLISGNGKTLYCAETLNEGLFRYDIEPNGDLSNKKLFWSYKDAMPLGVLDIPKDHSGIDGGCMDAEGGIWLSLLGLQKFVRVNEQGKITHEVHVDGDATACALGGKDGRTLFMATNKVQNSEDTIFTAMANKTLNGVVSYAIVDVPRGDALP